MDTGGIPLTCLKARCASVQSASALAAGMRWTDQRLTACVRVVVVPGRDLIEQGLELRRELDEDARRVWMDEVADVCMQERDRLFVRLIVGEWRGRVRHEQLDTAVVESSARMTALILLARLIHHVVWIDVVPTEGAEVGREM
jgi:hypothetical protein